MPGSTVGIRFSTRDKDPIWTARIEIRESDGKYRANSFYDPPGAEMELTESVNKVVSDYVNKLNQRFKP